MIDHHRILININEFNDSIIGFAIKLSICEKYNITIERILEKIRSKKLLLDAEDINLAEWFKQNLHLLNYLEKLVFTIQLKRDDAFTQIDYFSSINAKILIVSGNQKYLQRHERLKKYSVLIRKIIQNYDYNGLISISYSLREKLLDLNINQSQIMELYGDHELKNSVVWTFFVAKSKSEEVRAYQNRRSKVFKNYIVQTQNQFEQLVLNHKIYIYLDIICLFHFYQNLENLSYNNLE